MSTLTTAATAFDLPRMESGFEQKKQVVGGERVAMMTNQSPIFPGSA
ncbi:MAG: hypothetical protein WCP63_12310 [Cyanobium sp. ELA712]